VAGLGGTFKKTRSEKAWQIKIIGRITGSSSASARSEKEPSQIQPHQTMKTKSKQNLLAAALAGALALPADSVDSCLRTSDHPSNQTKL